MLCKNFELIPMQFGFFKVAQKFYKKTMGYIAFAFFQKLVYFLKCS